MNIPRGFVTQNASRSSSAPFDLPTVVGHAQLRTPRILQTSHTRTGYTHNPFRAVAGSRPL